MKNKPVKAKNKKYKLVLKLNERINKHYDTNIPGFWPPFKGTTTTGY